MILQMWLKNTRGTSRRKHQKKGDGELPKKKQKSNQSTDADDCNTESQSGANSSTTH